MCIGVIKTGTKCDGKNNILAIDSHIEEEKDTHPHEEQVNEISYIFSKG